MERESVMVDRMEDGVGLGRLEVKKVVSPVGNGVAPLSLPMFPWTETTRPQGGMPLSVGAPNSKAKDNRHIRSQRSMGDSPSAANMSESFVRRTPASSGFTKVFVTLKDERRSSATTLSPVGIAHIEPWSPATTVTSTPPFESRQASPATLQSNAVHRCADVAASDAAAGNDSLPPANNTRPAGSKQTAQGLRTLLSFFGIRRSRTKIAAAAEPPEPHGRFSDAIVDVSPSCNGVRSARPDPRPVSLGALQGKSPRAPFGGALHFVPDYFDDSDEHANVNDEDDNLKPSVSVVTKRTDVEGDVEEGGVHETTNGVWVEADADTAANARVAVEPAGTTVAASACVAEAPAVEPAVIVDGIVMPCPPSDKEKWSYSKTGRTFLVFWGMISFVTLTVGMWLFAFSSVYFLWFCGPTVFLMVYLIFHYFVVAVRGKDFEPDVHLEIVKKGEEENFLPTVDVFLPVCNEPISVINNTWKHVAELDYPHLTVHVLDDGAKDEVQDLAAEYGFQYVRRDNRPQMKKAGNLRYTFARTSADVVAIFDADFCPRSDFLRETTPYLLDPSIGIVQTPQFFRWREEQTWVEQGAGASQEFFYRMVQMNQDRFNGAVCVGSCALYRRAAVEPFGGVAAISHSEDMYTGFKMTELGYKIKYLPLCLAMGTCPDEPRSFFMQQYRWCMGSATLVFEKGFWKANIGLIHKICFFNGLLYYIASVLLLFLAPVPIMLLILVKADGVLWFYSGFAVPSILMAGVAVPLWASQRCGLSCHRIRVIQCYAHLFALKDRLMGTVAAWVPSGGGASSSSSKSYISYVWFMLTWTTLCTGVIIGGSIVRMMEFPWYHYVPAIALAMGSFYLNISTLWY